MTKADLLEFDEIKSVEQDFANANVMFDPFLDAAIEKFCGKGQDTVVIEIVANWLLKQLAKAVKRAMSHDKDDHRNWIQKLFNKKQP